MHHHLGVSAFATHAVVDTRSVVAVDDDVTTAVAAVLGCAVLTGGGALLNAAPPEPGQAVMVVGLGGVGMASALTAVALGAGEVVAVDGVEAKRNQARELGATMALDPAELESRGAEGRRRRRGGGQRARLRGRAGGHAPGRPHGHGRSSQRGGASQRVTAAARRRGQDGDRQLPRLSGAVP